MPDLYQGCDELKAELDQLRPIEKKHIKDITLFWGIDLAYSSNAIEGNTLTQSETRTLILDGITVGGKKVREIQEAFGHQLAFEHMLSIYEHGYDENSIKELHRLFYLGVDPDNAGIYRRENVIITGSDFVPTHHSKIADEMNKFNHRKVGAKHPVEEAGMAHMELVHIHPFIDGNGRTARLLMNLILIKNGYPVAIVPPIYRSEYIACCDSYHKGDSDRFARFLAKILEQSLTDYLRTLRQLE